MNMKKTYVSPAVGVYGVCVDKTMSTGSNNPEGVANKGPQDFEEVDQLVRGKEFGALDQEDW